MLAPSRAASNLVQIFEGCQLKAYPDPATGAEPWTIGYGHTGPDVHPGLIWTQDQADARLTLDLMATGRAVAALVDSKHTTQHQFDALCVFAFNVGLKNLKGSTLLKLHLAGDYAAAANQFLRWNKANGKEMRGLTRRRQAERNLYLT